MTDWKTLSNKARTSFEEQWYDMVKCIQQIHNCKIFLLNTITDHVNNRQCMGLKTSKKNGDSIQSPSLDVKRKIENLISVTRNHILFFDKDINCVLERVDDGISNLLQAYRECKKS